MDMSMTTLLGRLSQASQIISETSTRGRSRIPSRSSSPMSDDTALVRRWSDVSLKERERGFSLNTRISK